MKKLAYIIVAGIAAAAISGCEAINQDDIATKPARVIASTEGPGVKTVISKEDNEYVVKWQSGDQILVADDSAVDWEDEPVFKSFTLDDASAGQSEGEFIEDDPDVAFIGDNAFAIFPAEYAFEWPHEQMVNTTNSSNNHCLMIASGTILSDKHGISPLYFQHIGGALKISLTSSVRGAELSGITLKSETAYLSGYYSLTSIDDEEEYAEIEYDEDDPSSAHHDIIVTVEDTPALDAEKAVDIYVAMVPGSYSNLELTFEFTDASSKTLTSKGSVNISRACVTVAKIEL